MLTLSIASLRRHHACEIAARIYDLRRVLPNVAEDEPVPLRTWWDLPSTTIEDRNWSVRAAMPALTARVLGVRAACLAARRVLHLIGQNRSVCLAAIEAAEAWAAAPTAERAVVAAAARDAVVYDNADTVAAIYAAAAAYWTAAVAAGGDEDVDAPLAYAADAIYYGDDLDPDAAYLAEREAQRADLDRLLTEVTPVDIADGAVRERAT